MKKQLMLLLGMLSLLIPAGFVVSGSASAEPDPKVVVCKYVGTPGGTLHHVVIVSENTLNNVEDEAGNPFAGTFPFEWVDAHGQTTVGSIAIRYATEGEKAADFDADTLAGLCPAGEPEPEPDEASASVTVTPPTCVSGAVLVYGAITNAVFSGTADGTVGPGSYEVVATADDGAEFATGETTMTFSGPLAGPLTGAQCDENPPLTCPDNAEINAGLPVPEDSTIAEYCFLDVQGEQTCPTNAEINAGEEIPEGETVRSFCNEDNPPRNPPPNPPNPGGEQETPEVAGKQATQPAAPAVEVPTTVDSGL